MKALTQFAAGLALLLAVCAPVIAQDAAQAGAAAGRRGRGQGQGRGGARAMTVATIPANTLNYLVTLTDEQKTKIGDIQKKLAEDRKAATGDQAKMRELGAKATEDVNAILTTDQKAKLKDHLPVLGLLQQSRAIPLGALPAVKLTDEQKTKIKDLAKETQDKIAALAQADRRTGRMPLVAEFKTKVEALLTDDQKKAIADFTAKARAAA